MSLFRLSTLTLFLAAPIALGQTTYSSPVRVTNTPLPVDGAVRITGNTPVVNPSGVPLQVKAFDTIPVAQQGPVTVTPNGGTMNVTPNGGAMIVTPQGGSLNVTPASGSMPISGAVSLTGTPTVVLPVPVTFTRHVEGTFANDVGHDYSLGSLPSTGSLIEIQFAAARCVTPTADFEIGYSVITAGSNTAALTLTQTTALAYRPRWGLTTPVTIYAAPGAALSWRIGLTQSSSENTWCEFTVTGKVH